MEIQHEDVRNVIVQAIVCCDVLLFLKVGFEQQCKMIEIRIFAFILKEAFIQVLDYWYSRDIYTLSLSSFG